MSELTVGTLSGLAANSFVIDVASGSKLVQPGMILAVKDALFTGIQDASVASSDNVAVTDLSITHEVADPSNKLIISAFLGAAANSRGYGNVGIAIHDGTNLIAIGDADGLKARTTAGGLTVPSIANFVVTMPSVTFVHTPGSGSKTYTVRAVNLDGNTRTLYINRPENNDNFAERARAVSALVIQEVAV